ncbi:MAG: nucleotidyl transferase AbiEii/AbiGii toxin family protein [Campylobacterota bacterium]|nr:nucleotidyl transferase AbiEii/AbiGii toxin family protein [Campylobacterota bacterium]
MYDFEIQKNMLDAANCLLDKKEILNVSALGGGTALSAYYWNHRYSTDIDIFVHSKDDISMMLRPKEWDSVFLDKLNNLGYDGNCKVYPVYTEIVIQDDYKIQFFSVEDKTQDPYKIVDLWGTKIQIESIQEIIAKKIYYRAHKGNARDLFDIAIAIHKNPLIFSELQVQIEKFKELFETVSKIKENQELSREYIWEIELMNPNENYSLLAVNTIAYLFVFLENYCGAYDLGIELAQSEYILIEESAYTIVK